MGEIERADVPKVAHLERHEIMGNSVSLQRVFGRKKSIEEASEVAVENETDVAYPDLVIEAGRSWLP